MSEILLQKKKNNENKEEEINNNVGVNSGQDKWIKSNRQNHFLKIEQKKLNTAAPVMLSQQLRQCLSETLWSRQPNITHKHRHTYLFFNHIPISRVRAFPPDRLVFVVLIYIEETDRVGFQWAAVWLWKDRAGREGYCVSCTDPPC